MENLNRIRAKNAFEAAKDKRIANVNGGELVKKIPPLVINNGLIAVLAYAKGKNNDAWESIIAAMSAHLQAMGIMPQEKKDLLQFLLESDSRKLIRATDEILLWFAFFRRFATKSEQK